MTSSVREMWHGSDPVRVVQITDTHLHRQEGGTLLGLDTDFSLQQVIKCVQRERSAIDLVLATGDVSDHGSEEAYHRAKNYMANLSDEVFWLAGNHDVLPLMQAVLGSDEELVRVVYVGNWQIVLLNSQIPGEVGGELGAAELDWLVQCLQQAAARNVHSLVCLHHQPIPMGSAWIDGQIVRDREAFFDVLDQSSQVRGILWGHVHQILDAERKGVQLMSTPSSCIQFAPDNDGFKVDEVNPGYRWLDLYADGRIETAVSRVEGVEFSVDLESQGYM